MEYLFRGTPHIFIMKIIIETSMYLIVMALICLFSIDFISINMGITKVGQVEQYVEDYIELNGECMKDKSLDKRTVEAVNEKLSAEGLGFDYEYLGKTESHAYYKVYVEYSLRSAIFNTGKKHVFDGIARVSI